MGLLPYLLQDTAWILTIRLTIGFTGLLYGSGTLYESLYHLKWEIIHGDTCTRKRYLREVGSSLLFLFTGIYSLADTVIYLVN